jgi:hypothetical protein
MQRTYFQGLKLKPSFDQIVGYLENDQQFMSHPDRTYTRLKNDQYYSNLNMAGVNSINAQSDNLLKEQSRQLNRTQQMQTLGLSQPQVAAANIASGMGPQTQQFYMGSPQRPPFLPPRSSGRGSGATSGWASVVDPLDVDPFDRDELMDKLEEEQKKQEADKGAKRPPIQAEVAGEALARDRSRNIMTGVYGYGIVKQPASSSSGTEEVVVPTQQSASSSAGAIDTDKPVSQDTIKLFETFLAQAIAEAMGRPSRPLNPVELQNYLDGLKKTPINPFDVNSQGKPYEITRYPKNEGVKMSRWIGDQRLNISELQSRIFFY